MRHSSAVGILFLAVTLAVASSPGAEAAACEDTCFSNYQTCYLTNNSCEGFSSFCYECEDQYQWCTEGCNAPACQTDTCTSCDRAAAGTDADGDQVPDALEYDLAHRFFPTVKLQGYDYDLSVAYLFRGLATPYTVQPLSGGICDQDKECLEIRYGLAYSYDFGDNNPVVHWFIDHGHSGDSEFYAVLLQRTAPWSTASTDSGSWQLIRDFTAAHWGTTTDSSRMVSYGYCPPQCNSLGESSCMARSQCRWFQGLCAGISSDPGTSCGQFWEAEPCQFAGCQWFPPSCGNNGEVHCYSSSPLTTNNVLYASERKHGTYHSDSECDSGAWSADECPSNAYDLRSYKDGKLQNIGSPANHAAFDTTLQAPDLCGLNQVWDAGSFGGSTAYKKHFNPATSPMNWNLPAASEYPSSSGGCGEASCVPAQGTYISHFTGAGCTGTESYYLPYDGYAYQCRPWNGTGQCGTIHRTVTNRSYRYMGSCYDAWPSGNTLSDFVTVYR
ncbi:MAG TPA: hypothetical protein VHU81_08020 [Thermoanaerobaculia bacterium]|nr:hypothetical protein [Thermoanaerobaculia bacterium]